ncbi:MAG: flagellar filament capping protein FliD [Negativicutes bacterium]|nr:flagellar filament capping protein FliD [Negativicutes bacterium]
MSSSSSVTTSTSASGATTITGLASGLDTAAIVKKLVAADSGTLNKLKQNEQLAEWKQTAYQAIISNIQSFSDKYFDLTSSTSLLLQSNYQQFTASSDDSAVSVSAGSTATAGSHSVSVSQLATAATLGSDGSLTKGIEGTSAADFTTAEGESFTITLDGTAKTITLDASVTDAASLQTAIDTAVGNGKITVGTDDSGYLTLTAADSGVQEISLSAPSSGTSALSALGFGSDSVTSNRISTSDTLSTIAGKMSSAFTFNSDGQVEFSINGTSFTFDQDTTLSTMMSKINASEAGVTMAYDSLSGSLSLTANDTGAGTTITASDTGGSFISSVLTQATAGLDAKATIDGVSVTRSSNKITVNGVSYTLKDTTSSAATVTVDQDTDTIYNNIESFVNDYDTLIDTINTQLAETYDSDYPPLTDDQESSMSSTEITNWNAKAQTGLLANDSILSNFVSKMRNALMDSVSGLSDSLTSIGITASSSYSDKGKLSIDEMTLKAAISDDPSAVEKLFAQKSTSDPGTTAVRTMTASQRSTRYSEEGIAYRLYDILQDNISTITDSSGNKGALLEEAGITGDSSSTDNNLTTEINAYQTKISKEETRLTTEQSRWESEFSTMETYLEEMNAQSAYITSLSSSSSS